MKPMGSIRRGRRWHTPRPVGQESGEDPPSGRGASRRTGPLRGAPHERRTVLRRKGWPYGMGSNFGTAKGRRAGCGEGR